MRPNVVWISLESVRWDYTSLAPDGPATTPELSRIAGLDDTTTYDLGFSQSIWTPASVGSILTGTYPADHGVGMHGTGETVLDSELTTLPTVFGDAGYRTLCVSPNAYVSDATDLTRGFDDYVWLSKQAIGRDGYDAGGWARVRRRLTEWLGLGPRKRDDQTVTYAAVEEAESRLVGTDTPSFAYVHLGNTHYPYLPPEHWIDDGRLDGSVQAAYDAVLDVFGTRDDLVGAIEHGAPSEWPTDTFEALYEAEIALADHYVGRLFDALRAAPREAVVVVTGDHGELFGEHGLLGHNLVVTDETTRVPLLVYGLDGVDRSGPTQHVDVSRTLAGLVADPPSQFRGRSLREPSPGVAVSQRGAPNLTEGTAVSVSVPPELAAPFTSVRTPNDRLTREAFRETDAADTGVSAGAVEAVRSVPPADDLPARSETADYDEPLVEQLEALGYR